VKSKETFKTKSAQIRFANKERNIDRAWENAQRAVQDLIGAGSEDRARCYNVVFSRFQKPIKQRVTAEWDRTAHYLRRQSYTTEAGERVVAGFIWMASPPCNRTPGP
jgi:hypothetical protein